MFLQGQDRAWLYDQPLDLKILGVLKTVVAAPRAKNLPVQLRFFPPAFFQAINEFLNIL